MQGKSDKCTFTLYAFKKTMESYIDLAHEHATIWATLCTPKKSK